MEKKGESKLTTLQDVVATIEDGSVVGLGGFTLSRTQTALAHELIRQQKRKLTLVSTSISFQMDLLVAAGCVERVEHGAASIERFGLTYNLRRAIEEGRVKSEDYTHLSMASRFLAGALGVPFMPVRGLVGTDIKRRRWAEDKMAVIEDPFNPGEPPLAVVPACTPDVALLHVQKADRAGNLLIEGCTFHELELVRAAERVIVTCEELVDTEFFLRDPERTSVPFLHTAAVVLQPWGAYPTCCYGYYDYDRQHLEAYQQGARDLARMEEYLEENVYGTDYDSFLQKHLTPERKAELEKSMAGLIYGGEQT